MFRGSAPEPIYYSLQISGERMTQVRQEIIDIFDDHPRPLTAKDVKKMLISKKVPCHKATLYREIEFLKTKGIIHEINLGTEEKVYELTLREHHHHMVCFDCKKVEEVPVEKEFEKMEAYLYKKSGFSMIKHAAEFFGLCKKCESKY